MNQKSTMDSDSDSFDSSDSDSDSHDDSFDSSDDEAIIYRMELVERRRRKKKRKTTRDNEKNMVHNQQLKLHYPLPVHDDAINNKISTMVAVAAVVESTIICETAIPPSQSQLQLQPVASQQQQQQQHHLFQSFTTSISTTGGNKYNASANNTKSTHTKQQQHKGIKFVGDKPSQSNT